MKVNEEKDIVNFDYLTVIINKEKKADVLENYACFGWEVINLKDINNATAMEIEFKRPHKIKNKDDLQYIQVNMESELNKIGKLEINKHSKSTAFGIVLGIISLSMIVLGLIMSIKNYVEINLFIGGIMLCITGITLLSLMTFYMIKLSKKEKDVFKERLEKSSKLLENYCKIAKELRGVDDGRN